MEKKRTKETKKKAKCHCCGAEGFIYSTPFYYDEMKHWNDRGWIPEEAEGSDMPAGKQWVSSCIHKTGKKLLGHSERGEFNCNCTCGEEC